MTKPADMRSAIDLIEGALMDFGDLVDLPDLFEGADDGLMIQFRVPLRKVRRVCSALALCTKIINEGR